MENFHNKSINQTLADFKVTPEGLSDDEVTERERTRKNDDDTKQKKHGIVWRFFEQFHDLMIIILLIAAAVSIVIGIVEKTMNEIIDGIIILAIVLMNAIFGVAQEYKAEKSLEALNKLTQPECFVMRGGSLKKVSTKNLVAGDIVLLEAGTIVPADLRLIEAHQLKINESSLTGESLDVEKNAEGIYKDDTPLGERKNMAYKGSVVNVGRGLGVVIALGSDTEFGKIAKVITETKEELTPLQKSIKDVGKLLTFLVLGIAVVTFIIEVCISPLNVMDAFLTAVAISVAAIPESMPAVITIIMSLGVARLAKQRAIVRKMHSVETLGCCEVICSDKTGTITQNKMTVTSMYFNGKTQNGKFKLDEIGNLLVLTGLLCNDTNLSNGKILGDPTEIALTELGRTLKQDKFEFDKTYTRIDEIPFDSNRKLMSVLCEYQGKTMLTKGAPDILLSRCNRILKDGKIMPLTEKDRAEILESNEEMSGRALRVMGFAYKNCGQEKFEEEQLIFLGLMGMIDPPRKEIKGAVKKCKRAGMRPIMITGDYSNTALAIAKEIGLAKSMDEVITGEQLSKMKDEELDKRIKVCSVFARVSPEDKVRIVEAFKRAGKVVAMTGDGVNDAPSLKRASIGIGMGKTGTDVAKEVSDIIVTDDNFATIVLAVEEGRKIYGNIQKTVKFLFSANLAELLSLFIVTLAFPKYVFLFPVQILFVNLITDSLPAIALGVELPEANLMEQPPRDRNKSLFSNGIGWSIVILGIVQTMLVIASYVIGLKMFNDKIAVTMAFYTLNIVQMFYLTSMRTNCPFYKSKPHKNLFFLLSLAFCFALLSLFAFTPLRDLLSLVQLSGMQWGVVFGLSAGMFIFSEIYKAVENVVKKKKRGEKIFNKKEAE